MLLGPFIPQQKISRKSSTLPVCLHLPMFSVLSCRGGNDSIIREASVYALYPIRSLQWQFQVLPFAQHIRLS